MASPVLEQTDQSERQSRPGDGASTENPGTQRSRRRSWSPTTLDMAVPEPGQLAAMAEALARNQLPVGGVDLDQYSAVAAAAEKQYFAGKKWPIPTIEDGKFASTGPLLYLIIYAIVWESVRFPDQLTHILTSTQHGASYVAQPIAEAVANAFATVERTGRLDQKALDGINDAFAPMWRRATGEEMRPLRMKAADRIFGKGLNAFNTWNRFKMSHVGRPINGAAWGGVYTAFMAILPGTLAPWAPALMVTANMLGKSLLPLADDRGFHEFVEQGMEKGEHYGGIAVRNIGIGRRWTSNSVRALFTGGRNQHDYSEANRQRLPMSVRIKDSFELEYAEPDGMWQGRHGPARLKEFGWELVDGLECLDLRDLNPLLKRVTGFVRLADREDRSWTDPRGWDESSNRFLRSFTRPGSEAAHGVAALAWEAKEFVQSMRQGGGKNFNGEGLRITHEDEGIGALVKVLLDLEKKSYENTAVQRVMNVVLDDELVGFDALVMTDADLAQVANIIFDGLPPGEGWRADYLSLGRSAEMRNGILADKDREGLVRGVVQALAKLDHPSLMAVMAAVGEPVNPMERPERARARLELLQAARQVPNPDWSPDVSKFEPAYGNMLKITFDVTKRLDREDPRFVYSQPLKWSRDPHPGLTPAVERVMEFIMQNQPRGWKILVDTGTDIARGLSIYGQDRRSEAVRAHLADFAKWTIPERFYARSGSKAHARLNADPLTWTDKFELEFRDAARRIAEDIVTARRDVGEDVYRQNPEYIRRRRARFDVMDENERQEWLDFERTVNAVLEESEIIPEGPRDVVRMPLQLGQFLEGRWDDPHDRVATAMTFVSGLVGDRSMESGRDFGAVPVDISEALIDDLLAFSFAPRHGLRQRVDGAVEKLATDVHALHRHLGDGPDATRVMDRVVAGLDALLEPVAFTRFVTAFDQVSQSGNVPHDPRLVEQFAFDLRDSAQERRSPTLMPTATDFGADLALGLNPQARDRVDEILGSARLVLVEALQSPDDPLGARAELNYRQASELVDIIFVDGKLDPGVVDVPRLNAVLGPSTMKSLGMALEASSHRVVDQLIDNERVEWTRRGSRETTQTADYVHQLSEHVVNAAQAMVDGRTPPTLVHTPTNPRREQVPVDVRDVEGPSIDDDLPRTGSRFRLEDRRSNFDPRAGIPEPSPVAERRPGPQAAVERVMAHVEASQPDGWNTLRCVGTDVVRGLMARDEVDRARQLQERLRDLGRWRIPDRFVVQPGTPMHERLSMRPLRGWRRDPIESDYWNDAAAVARDIVATIEEFGEDVYMQHPQHTRDGERFDDLSERTRRAYERRQATFDALLEEARVTRAMPTARTHEPVVREQPQRPPYVRPQPARRPIDLATAPPPTPTGAAPWTLDASNDRVVPPVAVAARRPISEGQARFGGATVPVSDTIPDALEPRIGFDEPNDAVADPSMMRRNVEDRSPGRGAESPGVVRERDLEIDIPLDW
jgi:hypothetical protein